MNADSAKNPFYWLLRDASWESGNPGVYDPGIERLSAPLDADFVSTP